MPYIVSLFIIFLILWSIFGYLFRLSLISGGEFYKFSFLKQWGVSFILGPLALFAQVLRFIVNEFIEYRNKVVNYS
jgi:hypothetical protein